MEIILLVSLYGITILGVTVGFHRLFTHRAYEAGPLTRLILAVCGSMSAQGPVIEWCAQHRRHHQHSDREGDPHSPHLHGTGVIALLRGFIHAHLGWLFEPGPTPQDLARSVPDLLADRVLLFVDRFFWVWLALGWIIPAAIGYTIGHTWWSAFSGFIWGGLVRTCLLHHVTWSVNSVCHVWGTRPFSSADHSRNNAIFGVLAFGEGWHNNHHAFPTSARHGLRWWQLDLSWLTIIVLEKLRLVWNVRLPGEKAMEIKRRVAA
jgi:stearoyl-CoA desaturase (delta-9 desaturase)